MTTKRNIALLLSYLGTPFSGWQKTAPCSTKGVEEILQDALARILRETPKLQAASRTDAGVHAEGQCVNFFIENPIDLSLLRRALNGTLPKEISVVDIAEKPQDFHPTLDCVKKQYRYQICQGRTQLPFYRHLSWHFPNTLNDELMHHSARALLGSHDFSAFCNDRTAWDRNPICHIEAIDFLPLEGERLCITITGDHFLYKMVRNIIGTLLYIGAGKLTEEMALILQNKDRKRAGITAPAYGLCLYRLYYKDDT